MLVLFVCELPGNFLVSAGLFSDIRTTDHRLTCYFVQLLISFFPIKILPVLTFCVFLYAV